MLSKRRVLAVAAFSAATLAAPWWGPGVMRRIEWFDVRRVEVSGTRLLAPHAVLAAAEIRRGQSVWDDAAGWEAALRAHPAIAEARVTRQLPATLRVRVEEKRPVAFVEAEALQPATAAGELLPVDPSRSAVDLPIVRGAWKDEAKRKVALRLLEEVGRLGELDPGLFSEVSEVRAGATGSGVVVLSHRLAEILVPAGLESARLAELRAVLGELEGRASAAQGAGPPFRVDLRFRDQIVVRPLSSS